MGQSISTARRGVTLIEAVLYISVALALIVGGLVFFQQASQASRMESTVRLGSALIQEARTMYADTSGLVDIPEDMASMGYAGEVSESLIVAGAVPSNAVGQAARSGFSGFPSRIMSVWGTPVNIYVGRRAGSPVVQIAFSGIPSKVCARLAATSAQRTNLLSENVDFVIIQDRTISGSTMSYFTFTAGGLPLEGVAPMCDQNGDGITSALLIQAFL